MRLNASSTAWETVANAGFSPGEAWSTSLVLTPGGVPYVAIQDHENGDKTTVIRLNAPGSAWETIGNAGLLLDPQYTSP